MFTAVTVIFGAIFEEWMIDVRISDDCSLITVAWMSKEVGAC